jgi:hypothetical protein
MESVASQPAVAGKPEAAEERLLDLFTNRAELKREFNRLRQERDSLRKRIEQQDGRILRMQQRLDQLEGLLSDPLRAANVSLYYQLRSLWVYCRRRLERMAVDLGEQARKAEMRSSTRAFEARRAAALSSVDDQIAKVEQRLAECAENQAQLDGGIIKRLWRGLVGRADDEIAQSALQATRDAAIEQLAMLQGRREQILAESVPGPRDLSLAAKRQINLAVIGLAQELYLQFSERDLAAYAREAMSRKPADVAFGTRNDCLRLSKLAAQLLQLLESRADMNRAVRSRGLNLARDATYRTEKDAVPGSGCCILIPKTLDERGQIVGTDVIATNVMGEDYWDLCTVLVN